MLALAIAAALLAPPAAAVVPARYLRRGRIEREPTAEPAVACEVYLRC